MYSVSRIRQAFISAVDPDQDGLIRNNWQVGIQDIQTHNEILATDLNYGPDVMRIRKTKSVFQFKITKDVMKNLITM